MKSVKNIARFYRYSSNSMKIRVNRGQKMEMENQKSKMKQHPPTPLPAKGGSSTWGTKFKRVIIIVLDSVGIGNAPDAAEFGDEGANTLVNMSKSVAGGLKIPNLQRLGLGNILPDEIIGCPSIKNPIGSYGRLIEKSMGKDTTIGHWEMIGIITEKPFPVFPEGFPPDLMEKWKADAGVEGWLWNKPASGTEIIKKFGEEHIKTGLPIVYTSADSVFQIAAHEKYFGLEKLCRICEKTRKLVDPIRLARVIARPFVGETATDFTRTSNRHDYSLKPSEPNILTQIRDSGFPVSAIGKINDIFAGSGITETQRTNSNMEGMELLGKKLETLEKGLIFVNLVEFDMLYGHRRNPEGYANCLTEFDIQLSALLKKMTGEDLLIITADHGLDPTYKGTDHTREMVPVLKYSSSAPSNNLGIIEGFDYVGKTALKALNVQRYHAQFLNLASEGKPFQSAFIGV